MTVSGAVHDVLTYHPRRRMGSSNGPAETIVSGSLGCDPIELRIQRSENGAGMPLMQRCRAIDGGMEVADVSRSMISVSALASRVAGGEHESLGRLLND